MTHTHKVKIGTRTYTTTTETATPVPPTPTPIPPTPVPPSGIPPLGPRPANALLWHDFAKDGMGPFRAVTFPNDHDYATDPKQLMRQYCTYVTDAGHVNLTEGPYLTLRCDRNPAVASPSGVDAWRAAFVSTGLDGKGGAATFSSLYGTLEWCAQIVGRGPGAWQTLWEIAQVTGWHGQEGDGPELIKNIATANLHGPVNTEIGSVAVDEGWHRWKRVWTPSSIAYLLDGVQYASRNIAFPERMALAADSKAGLAAPTAATPTLVLRVAWVTVD